MTGWVYIMTNRPNGVLYIGVTADLIKRAWQHRFAMVDGFTSRYGLTMLVWYEEYALIASAIRREKTMKHWPRGWKVALIEKTNPTFRDLYNELNA